MPNGFRTTKTAGSLTLLTVIVAVAILYFARTVLMPLALAVLFAFLLAPLVSRVRRLGLGRIPSVAVVLLIAFSLIAVLGAGMVLQMNELGQNLPE